MAGNPKRISDDQEREAINQHNMEMIAVAPKALETLMRSALASGQRGSIAVRIPIQRGKFGNIRKILEVE